MKLKSILILVSLLALGATGAQAQCHDIQYRLWQPDGATWYSFGEEVVIGQGESGHLYIHLRSQGNSSYTTYADVGPPTKLGFRGPGPQEVKRHLAWRPQSGDDRKHGRLQFNANQPGVTSIGYRITGVKPPGKVGRIPQKCRAGVVRVRVEGGGQGRPSRPAPAPQPHNRRDAAAGELVDLMYEAFLRRDRGRGEAESFVDTVYRGGLPALETLAKDVMLSREFGSEALERINSRGRDEVGQLLVEIYRSLYGRGVPDREDQVEDYEDLDLCLSNDRGSREACANLASNLIDTDLFEDQNGRLLDDLEGGRGRGRGRRR